MILEIFNDSVMSFGPNVRDNINNLSKKPSIVIGTAGEISGLDKDVKLSVKAVFLDSVQTIIENGFESELHAIFEDLDENVERVSINVEENSTFDTPVMKKKHQKFIDVEEEENKIDTLVDLVNKFQQSLIVTCSCDDNLDFLIE
eukprot:UN33639